MKTYTPELSPSVLGRLADYAASFADDFPQARPALWAGLYLQGLLLDGERKSIEPPARRVALPEGLASKDPEQALQQFVDQGPWDEQKVLRRYRKHNQRCIPGWRCSYGVEPRWAVEPRGRPLMAGPGGSVAGRGNPQVRQAAAGPARAPAPSAWAGGR